MAWTYNTALLATSELMQVRFEIGDTDSSDPLLQNEEIEYVISQSCTYLAAAVRCCQQLARHFAREVDHSMGPAREAASQKSRRFEELARDLSRQVIGMNSPTAGGVYDDTPSTTIVPAFTKGLMDNE